MHCHCHAQSVTDSKLSTFKSHTTLVSHLSSMDQLYTLSSHIHVPQRYPSVHHPYLTPIHTQAARSWQLEVKNKQKLGRRISVQVGDVADLRSASWSWGVHTVAIGACVSSQSLVRWQTLHTSNPVQSKHVELHYSTADDTIDCTCSWYDSALTVAAEAWAASPAAVKCSVTVWKGMDL